MSDLTMNDYPTTNAQQTTKKLVRSKVPAMYSRKNKVPVKIQYTEGRELLTSLRDKLVEETTEFWEAVSAPIENVSDYEAALEELADILQVAATLMGKTELQIMMQDALGVMEEKCQRLGDYSEGILMEVEQCSAIS